MLARKILLIEDDPMSLELLELLLERQGLPITACTSGEEAVSRLREDDSIDTVLTDLQMPGIHWSALPAALRSASKQPLKIIAMSATAPERPLLGVDAFLLKPFAIEQFLDLLREDRKPAAAPSGSTAMLDETIYDRMAAAMPQQQLRAMYKFALDDAANRLTEMRRCRATGDYGGFRKQAHAAKGGCAMIGAAELASIASVLERNGITGMGDDSLLDDFGGALERVRRMLETRFAVDTGGENR